VPVKDSVIPNRRARRHPDKAAVPARRWASLKEAADYMDVTTRTIRQWITDGKIHGYRINSRFFRVDLNEVDAAMQPFGGASVGAGA
jgi:excisionase family DNA binding protein